MTDAVNLLSNISQKELTINEIFNGSKEYNYPGIIKYLKLISQKMFKAEKYCENYYCNMLFVVI